VREGNEAAQRMAVVVEDDDDIRELLVDVLTEDGYVVMAFAEVDAALALLHTIVPALIVTDLMFPSKHDGWYLAHAVRANPQLARVPLLLCSAALQTRSARETAAQLRAAWVPKPFAIHTLLTNVQLAATIVAAHF
jgi:DNA-binding response OmpR family regulator